MYQTFHSSNESMMRFSLFRAAATRIGGRDDALDELLHVDGRGEELLRIAPVLLVVRVARDEVDVVERLLEDLALPRSERRHAATGGAARHEFDGRVELAHRLRGARGELAVVHGVAVAQLPRAVHLVAEAPHLHTERLGMPVGGPLIRARRRDRGVGVLEEIECLLGAAGAEVHGEHQVAADLVEPMLELVQADLIGLRRMPREVQAPRALVLRADAILPAIPRDEVAAGVADGGDAEFLDELDDIRAESFGIRRLMPGLVDAVVHVTAEMFDEAAEDTAIDVRDLGTRINETGCSHSVDLS